ncbi:CREB-regulated transcription coactivator 2 [Bagarius yarrelli]|uniref:CREB-regulated transcription coactivator 2 n=1 Tax=Bagarius yarrelli TaxID=175774 RepID=A0A556TPY9_BAGYA|nr:CREB-regulated transcription coactivator 2 [Bagarius yarrelli]
MSAAGAGACGPGPGAGGAPGSGVSNPRKFSEKIALHTQRQAEETAAFQEVMMDITSTRIQAQKVRLARTQSPYYGGSLPNVNQIGRNAADLQGPFHMNLESNRSTRHHGLVERVPRDRRFASPSRPYRRHMDSSHCSSAYLSPPPDPSWRRTNSDSALHTSVMKPPTSDPFSAAHALNPHGRSGVFPYPVPPIEENVLDEGRLLKPWDTKKLPLLSLRPKSCEVPGINIFPSPDQQANASLVPSALNTGGSLPDLSSLHFPSPLPTPLDPDEPGYPSLSGGNSTGNLASTLTQLGINTTNAFNSPGLLASLQGTLSNPTLQSSLSNPNIQLSLSSHSFPNSISSASLQSSLSNPSLQSSLSSSPSLQSSLSNQSLHSSLSNSSLTGQSLLSGNNAVGPGSCLSSYSTLLPGQVQPQLSSSPRRRGQLTPLNLPQGTDSRRHHPKQFSPTISTTLTSITQGVPLDTSQLMMDQRLPPYPGMSSDAQKGCSSPKSGQPPVQHQQLPHHQQTTQPSQHHPHSHPQHRQTMQLHMQNMHNLHKTQNFPFEHMQRQQGSHLHPQLNQNHCSAADTPGPVNSHGAQDSDVLTQTHTQGLQQEPNQNLPQLQQISQSLASELGLYNDSLLLNSLLEDPYLGLQLTGRQNHNLSQQSVARVNTPVLCASSTEKNPGVSPPGLSKEITSALSGVPGFEVEAFSSDDTLRMEPLALDGLSMLTDGDLMLADPAVEDSFRSDRLK